jgi:hypothetical protein
MDSYQPAPALVKGLLVRWHNLPYWDVRPPLVSLPENVLDRAADTLQQAGDMQATRSNRSAALIEPIDPVNKEEPQHGQN